VDTSLLWHPLQSDQATNFINKPCHFLKSYLKLRCALSNEVFSADIPKHVHKKNIIQVLKQSWPYKKYYMAMPFHRQEYFQSFIGFPIPASLQWQLMEELAANCSVIHNDDTVLRIVDTIRHNRQNPDKKRTGMYTTRIWAQNDAHQALFYNSGENLEDPS
jgi:transposase